MKRFKKTKSREIWLFMDRKKNGEMGQKNSLVKSSYSRLSIYSSTGKYNENVHVANLNFKPDEFTIERKGKSELKERKDCHSHLNDDDDQ